MREPDNIQAISALQPDFMGFIFYEKSPRDVSDKLSIEAIKKIPAHINKVGVFVNEDLEKVKATRKMFGFSHVQLHGNESVDYCRELKKLGISVIKVFSIEMKEDFQVVEKYSEVSDYFLFDTKSPKHGGTGLKFDWDLLENYKGKTPVILSGGIGPNDADLIKEISNKYTFIEGLDLNSKFEISPALKDDRLVETFLGSLNN